MKKRILFTVFVLSMLLLIAAAPVYAAPEPTPTPPSGDSRLVGIWVPRPEYTDVDYAQGVEFHADGTFYCVLKAFANTAAEYKLTMRGNYSIQGDKVVCTNVLESWTQRYGGNAIR